MMGSRGSGPFPSRVSLTYISDSAERLEDDQTNGEVAEVNSVMSLMPLICASLIGLRDDVRSI